MNWKTFMLESNRIEGEDRLNPGDENAFDLACSGLGCLGDITALHFILGEHLNLYWVGKLRTCNVQVGRYLPPNSFSLPQLMAEYIKEFPLLNSYQAHNQFEMIHPFRDLNGRVGRLIWLSKAINEGYDFKIPFLQKYYYQTLSEAQKG